MIRSLLEVAPAEARRPLRWNLAGLAAESILMGVGFAFLVPILRSLLSGDTTGTWVWVGAMAAVLALYAVVRFATQILGFQTAIGMADGLFQRLGNHIAQLPLGWFDATRVGGLGRLTSQGVIDVMGVPAHLLRPVVNAFLTPITVILVMFVFDWRLALAALITAPLAWLVYRWSGSLVALTDHRTHEAAADASGRIVEFAQAQAVLRAFGRSSENYQHLEDALREQRDASRAQLLTAAPGLACFILVVQLAFSILVLFGLNLALGGDFDVAELLAILALAARYVHPLIEAADLGGALRISQNSLGRMDDLFATEPLPEPSESGDPQEPTIDFESVEFG